MNEYDRDKGTKKPMLVYSEITGRIYIAYKDDLIDVTEKAKLFCKYGEHDKEKK